MKDYLKNLFAAHGAAFWLNLLGLSLAFVIFYVLMAEVMWHVTYDRFHKDADRVCQVFHKNNHFTKLAGEDHPETETLTASIAEEITNCSQQFETSVTIFLLGGACDLVAMNEGHESAEPIKTLFRLCTPGLFEVFTFDLIEGDTDAFRDPHNVFVPLSLAKKLYGEQDSYVGRRCGVEGYWDVNVGGVYRDFPTNSQLPNDVYQLVNEQQRELLWSNKEEYNHYLFVKLREGADGEQVSEELLANSTMLREIASHFSFIPLPELYYTESESAKWLEATGGDDKYLAFHKRNANYTMPAILCIVALLVVFIAAINSINFSMAMVPYQIKEVNVRRIFGAQAASLRRELIWETFLNVAIAVLLALFVLYVIIQFSLFSEWLKADLAFYRNSLTLGILAIVVVLIPLVAGGYPAWYLTSRRPALVVNGSFALSPAGRAFRRMLIGFQFVISLVVLLLLLLFLGQHHYMYTAPVGYDRDSVFYAEVHLDREYMKAHGYMGKEVFLAPMMQALQTNPAISEASWGHQLGGNINNSNGAEYKGKLILYDRITVEHNYLKTMGIKVTSGRDFRPEDEGRNLLIFNEQARKEFGLELNDKVGRYEVIGFTEDIHTTNLKNKIKPTAFEMSGNYNTNLVIRLASPDRKEEVCRFIEEQAEKITGRENRWSYKSGDEIMDEAFTSEQKQLKLLFVVTIVSLLIPLIGVFGLVLFETRAKRKEIGIRKVFGATTRGILVMFNMQYLRTLAMCFILAAPVAYTLYNRWIESFAYRTPMHWWLFGVAFLIVAFVVCLTVTVQSWRAAKERPVETIMK